MTTKAQDKILTMVWIDEFINEAEGVCSLCGNCGRIDTTSVKSPRGTLVGKLHYCICPNGRRMSVIAATQELQDKVDAVRRAVTETDRLRDN